MILHLGIVAETVNRFVQYLGAGPANLIASHIGHNDIDCDIIVHFLDIVIGPVENFPEHLTVGTTAIIGISIIRTVLEVGGQSLGREASAGGGLDFRDRHE